MKLIDEIKNAKVEKGTVALWWLGQMGYVMKSERATILVDGFVTPREDRLVPPAFDASEADCFDAVLGTHDHDDHIDIPAWKTIAKVNPNTRFICPAPHAESVCERACVASDRVIGITEGDTVKIGDMTIQAIPAAHEFLEFDSLGRSLHVSYIINGKIFHAGDTLTYDGQRAKLRQFSHLSAMILPINGRDAERFNRGCIGNMTFQEAVDLAGDIAPEIAIPGHYDMFAGNLGSPEAFRDYLNAKYPCVGCHIPTRLMRYDVKM